MKPFSPRRGQSTTEFALMLPLIFAILFGAIEYAYYLGAIHYTNYGTFVAARAQIANDNPNEAAGMVLNGNVTSLDSGGTRITPDTNSVKGTLAWGPASTPGFNQVILNNMDVEMEVVLGPPECGYELKTQASKLSQWSDNKMECN